MRFTQQRRNEFIRQNPQSFADCRKPEDVARRLQTLGLISSRTDIRHVHIDEDIMDRNNVQEGEETL